ncbi:MAG: zinc ribbon domain-containing protein [Nitrospirae bacterium]|nr:zinc ribbon domain-containing protein [Nitrospirota bacterium]
MPIYEYICTKCNERFSLLQSISCEPGATKCPNCSSHDVKKMVSSFCCSSGSGKGIPSSVPSGGFSGGG